MRTVSSPHLKRLDPSPNIWKDLIRLSVPLAIAQVGQNLMGLVDTAFLGRVSPVALGAAGIGNGLFFSIIILPLGIILGAETFISQLVGAKEDARAAQTLRQGIWWSLLLFVPSMCIYLLTIGSVPFWGIEEALEAPTMEYVFARIPGALGFLIYAALRSYVQGYGRAAWVTLAVVIANLVNVPLNGLLIFGDEALHFVGLPSLGLPSLGVLGAGIATSIASWIQVVVILPSVLKVYRKHVSRSSTISILAMFRMDWNDPRMRGIFRVGFPVGLQLTLEVGVFSLVGILMGKLGSLSAAAHQIAITLAATSFHAVLGISMATSVLVGQRIGAADPKGAFRTGLVGLFIGSVFMSICACVFFFFPAQLARLFSSQQHVILQTALLLQIAAVFQLFDGAQAIAAGALRGAGDTRWSLSVNLVAHWCIGMPLALFLGFYWGQGASGMWWGLTVGLIAASIGLTLRFCVQGRRGYASLVHDAPRNQSEVHR